MSAEILRIDDRRALDEAPDLDPEIVPQFRKIAFECGPDHLAGAALGVAMALPAEELAQLNAELLALENRLRKGVVGLTPHGEQFIACIKPEMRVPFVLHAARSLPAADRQRLVIDILVRVRRVLPLRRRSVRDLLRMALSRRMSSPPSAGDCDHAR